MESDTAKATDQWHFVPKLQDICMDMQGVKLDIMETSAGSLLLLSHQNVIPYDINVHELLVITY
jgi:hypothetical protein